MCYFKSLTEQSRCSDLYFATIERPCVIFIIDLLLSANWTCYIYKKKIGQASQLEKVCQHHQRKKLLEWYVNYVNLL